MLDDTAYHCMTTNDCNERANNWRQLLGSRRILESLGKGWLHFKTHTLVTVRIDNAHPCARILCKQEANHLDSATSRSPMRNISLSNSPLRMLATTLRTTA